MRSNKSRCGTGSVRRSKGSGFTLIELMIAVVIIGILASIGYPSYQNSVMRSRRALAQADLMAFASAMERRFSVVNTYQGAAVGGADTGPPAQATFYPSTSPTTGGDAYYNLSIQAASPLTYTLQAAPIAGTSQANDGTLTLDQAGVRQWNGQPGWDQ